MSLIEEMIRNTPAFSNPENAVGDAVRVFDIVAGMVMFGLFLRTARQVRNTRQWGMYSLVMFGIASTGTEIQNLGTIVTYRLLFNTAGVVLGIMFLWKTSHAVHEVEAEKESE